ncbi:MAG TPA: pyrroline-5-carboxylate reductase [Quisquiliibacterium sp.]|nr:pyrroline-5-carboxylate reductase [Quisquiliibacterium sp.]
MRITFIGGGNMASALIGGLLAGRLSPGDIRVVDPVESQRALLVQRFGVGVSADAAGAVAGSDVTVLSVKPQQMREAASALAAHVRDQLVISVAAGIRASDLSRWLGGHARIVRAMPNTPALIGQGVTGLAPFPGLADADRARADEILRAVGQTVWVDEEGLLDAVTAVSGSGPAYVFHFIEAMLAGARALGLNEAQARALTIGTFTGAARLAAESDEPPSVLRERVTSKGGTTAAALAVMSERGIATHIADAMAAACRRSVELGDEFGQG